MNPGRCPGPLCCDGQTIVFLEYFFSIFHHPLNSRHQLFSNQKPPKRDVPYCLCFWQKSYLFQLYVLSYIKHDFISHNFLTLNLLKGYSCMQFQSQCQLKTRGQARACAASVLGRTLVMYIFDQGCARAQCAAAQGLGALGNDAVWRNRFKRCELMPSQLSRE